VGMETSGKKWGWKRAGKSGDGNEREKVGMDFGAFDKGLKLTSLNTHYSSNSILHASLLERANERGWSKLFSTQYATKRELMSPWGFTK
jgi:hypothetical protein